MPGDGTNGHGGTTECDWVFGCGGTAVGQHISILSIFNTTTTDTGPTRVANVSLSDDAQGTWSLLNSFAGGVLVQSGGDVVNGAMVPEPGSLGLLAAGGLVLTRRWRGV